jgi:hypothetical protein
MSKKLPSRLLTPNGHYSAHKSHSVEPTASQTEPVHITFLELDFNLKYYTKLQIVSVVWRSNFLATDSEVLCSIPGVTTFSEKQWVCGSPKGSTQPRWDNRGANWMKSSGSGL